MGPVVFAQPHLLLRGLAEVSYMKNLMDAGRKIKLIVSDLDGTLLGTDKRISVINQRVIKKAKEKNILFTFCTGRIATMIEPYVKTLGIDIPVITTNGAVVWDPVKKEIITHKPMDPEEAMEIAEYCRCRNLEYCALTLEVNYFSHNNYLIKRFLLYNKISRESNMRQMILSVMEEGSFFPEDLNIYKILIYSSNPFKLAEAVSDINSFKKTRCTSSEANQLDVMNTDVDKGTGIEIVMKFLRLKPDEVCAIGDYDNDIPMLKKAGISVAMGNALPEAKELADYITKSNEDNGVAWFISQYILNSN